MSLSSLVVHLVLSFALPLAPSPAAWAPPVVPLVVERPFAAPSGPYAPGHRGVDLAAAPGTVVRAPAPGTVRFAGRVAGKTVISLEHPHRILGRTGWRTTYDGVRPSVAVGDRVRAGEPLGHVVPHSHSAGIHWGLKNGRAYADPMMLLRRPVVLKPLGD
jgi:murein DD-endopeptidase MepM/ murein hydrolase activator NlpD